MTRDIATNSGSRFKVGDKVFIFDQNRRVYTPGKGGGPIYREHFREVTIDGETTRSWLVGKHCPTKYPKSTCAGLFTAEQIEDECWKKEHCYRIADLTRFADVETLKKIAEILGYKP